MTLTAPNGRIEGGAYRLSAANRRRSECGCCSDAGLIENHICACPCHDGDLVFLDGAWVDG
jgi:hypothetical protein